MRKSKYHELKYNIVGGFMTVVKILELVGSSENSWDGAVQEALAEAAKTVKNIVGIDVLGYKAEVENNKIAKYKAHVRVAFTVER
jgi:flavin-binding protein dodecin